MAARPDSVSGLGVGDHAAADAGRDGRALLRPVSRRSFLTSWPSRMPNSMRSCTCGPASATTRGRATCIARRGRRARRSFDGADLPGGTRGTLMALPGHRPLDGGRDPGTVAQPAPRRSWTATPSASWRATCGVEGWTGSTPNLKTLWAIRGGAARHEDRRRLTIRRRSWTSARPSARARGRPAYDSCPLAADCRANRRLTTGRIPAPRPKRKREAAAPGDAGHTRCRSDGAVLLERRPDSGVWGGLWCFPEADAVDRSRRGMVSCEASAYRCRGRTST